MWEKETSKETEVPDDRCTSLVKLHPKKKKKEGFPRDMNPWSWAPDSSSYKPTLSHCPSSRTPHVCLEVSRLTAWLAVTCVRWGHTSTSTTASFTYYWWFRCRNQYPADCVNLSGKLAIHREMTTRTAGTCRVSGNLQTPAPGNS